MVRIEKKIVKYACHQDHRPFKLNCKRRLNEQRVRKLQEIEFREKLKSDIVILIETYACGNGSLSLHLKL